MLSRTRSIVAVALAATAFTGAPALADDPGDLRGENAASAPTTAPAAGSSYGTTDVRGENAASLSDKTPAAVAHTDLRGENAASVSSAAPAQDLRTADARQPLDDVQPTQPVVVEVTDPADAGFDWTAAIIGVGAGLALAVLAGVGVAGGRRRHVRPVG